MKRLLTTISLVFVLAVLGTGFVPSTVHAQATSACPSGSSCVSGCGATQTSVGSCTYGGNNPGFCCQSSSTGSGGTAGTTGSTNSGAPATPTSGNLQSGWLATVMISITQLFAWLVGVAAITLDNVVYYTVVQMGSYVKNLTAVGVTWQVLRNLGNIVLIFGFLAVGITTILDVDWYGSAKKMLPLLLVVAIFLNFSLFIAEAVIDVGNIFATEFYTQINAGNPPSSASLSGINNEPISNAIMNSLGLQTIEGAAMNPSQAQLLFQGSGANTLTIGFMSILLYIIVAFIMFSLAFILIARFVVLLFLIIVAPVGFAGLIVPGLERTAKSWWNALFQQTITAPILLLMLYIALAVITDANFLTGLSGCTAGGTCSASYTGFATGNLLGFASVMLSFLVAMGLLAAVIIVSRKMSAFGGTWATKTAGALTFGVTSWAGRRTVGRGAYYAARGLRQSKTFNKVDAWTGRATTRLLDRGAKGSFDLRGTKAISALPLGGIGAGTAQKGGFAEDRKQSIKQHQAAATEIENAFKDKGSGRFEPEVIAARTEALDLARKEKNAAQGAKDAARAEVERINKLPQTDAGTLAQLHQAEEDLAAADGRLTKADKGLAGAQEEMQKDIGKAAGDVMRKNIAARKTDYAEGLETWGNPVNLVYGPSTGAAARKIKESLKQKSTKEQMADLAAKMKREEEEEEKKNEGGAASPEPKEAAEPAPSSSKEPKA
jgi:hypothetical protein